MSHLTILSFLLPLLLLIRQSAANILAAFYLLNDYHIFYFFYLNSLNSVHHSFVAHLFVYFYLKMLHQPTTSLIKVHPALALQAPHTDNSAAYLPYLPSVQASVPHERGKCLFGVPIFQKASVSSFPFVQKDSSQKMFALPKTALPVHLLLHFYCIIFPFAG